MVRTKTLTKNTIVQIDAAPFRQWYEAHYAVPLGRKKIAEKKYVSITHVNRTSVSVSYPEIQLAFSLP